MDNDSNKVNNHNNNNKIIKIIIVMIRRIIIVIKKERRKRRRKKHHFPLSGRPKRSKILSAAPQAAPQATMCAEWTLVGRIGSDNGRSEPPVNDGRCQNMDTINTNRHKYEYILVVYAQKQVGI